jgi:predicted nucleic acid-binding protein
MTIFLDANILFSAAFAKSRLAGFLLNLQRHATLITNAYAREEAGRNLAAKHVKKGAHFDQFCDKITIVPLDLFEIKVRLAEKDRPILCGAISGKADYLLTGDKKDFGHLFGRTIRGVKIVTVALLVEELAARGVIEM